MVSRGQIHLGDASQAVEPLGDQESQRVVPVQRPRHVLRAGEGRIEDQSGGRLRAGPRLGQFDRDRRSEGLAKLDNPVGGEKEHVLVVRAVVGGGRPRGRWRRSCLGTALGHLEPWGDTNWSQHSLASANPGRISP